MAIVNKRKTLSLLFQKYGYGGWVHMDHSVSCCSGPGPREANMMKDGKFFRKVKVIVSVTCCLD